MRSWKSATWPWRKRNWRSFAWADHYLRNRPPNGTWPSCGTTSASFKKDSGTEVSVKAFKKAVALDPQNPVAHLNLANAYWGLRDPALTENFLRKVLTLAPDEPFPHVAIADLLQEKVTSQKLDTPGLRQRSELKGPWPAILLEGGYSESSPRRKDRRKKVFYPQQRSLHGQIRRQ